MAQYTTDTNLSRRIAIHAFSVNPLKWSDWYVEHVPFRPGQRILDIGCGNGHIWKGREGMVDASSEVTLADASTGMLGSAREALTGAGPNWRFVRADVCDLPFGDDSFDIVMANHMLYHADDIARAIAEIARVLRPGGVLFASTNGRGHMRELHEWVADFRIDVTNRFSLPADRFGLENGGDLLAASFASVELDRYEDSLVVPAVDPIMDYVCSIELPPGPETDERLRALRAHLSAILERDGAIRIAKESGVFICTGSK